MKELLIHVELEELLPPLSESEFAGLEADILERGCLSPLVTWGDYIVDGHNRYKICSKHEIPYGVVSLEFDSIQDARFWAWSHQEHRRNLTPFQRSEIAEQFRPMLAEKAKARMSAGGSKKCLQKSNEGMSTLTDLEKEKQPITVRDQLAQIAGVSNGTMAKAEYLHEHADDETKQKLRSGETTINREYTRLRCAEQGEVIEDELEPMTPTYPNPMDTFKESITLQHILVHETESLITCLFSFFDATYRAQLVLDLLEKIQSEDGQVAVESIIHSINKQFPTIQ